MNARAQTAPPEGGKARRVYLLLRDDIASDRTPPGTLLPGEHRLAATFGVSRITVRRALEALARDGWIEKRTGAGSLVLPRPAADPRIAADFSTLLPQLVELDRQTTARLLSFAYVPCPGPVADALGLAPGAQVQTAVRVRSVDGTPFSHLTTYVPGAIARTYDEADMAREPLYRLLERSGTRVAAAEQTVTATLAAPDVAEALDIATGSALLSVRRTLRDGDGHGVEHLAALYRPDLFRLEMTLSRVGDGNTRHWAPVVGADDG